jgi:ABC-2 type transport system ATP-binding protein
VEAFAATDVTVRYGSARGILDVSVSAAGGEVLGLLGPNGAGKTTLLRAALDLVHPNAGSVHLMGVPSTNPAARESVAYLPGELNLPKRLTGHQVIARFTARRPKIDSRRVDRFADAFGVDLDRRIGSLSKGNRQKIGLVLAFAPNVPVLLLDEPTSGLDPLVQQVFSDIVRQETDAGTCVILSSHVLSELEHLAQRVAVLRDGKVAAVESVSVLQHRTRQHLEVRLASAQDVQVVIRALQDVAGATCTVLPNADRAISITVDGPVDPVVKILAEVTVLGLSTAGTQVEDLLLDYYQSDPS